MSAIEDFLRHNRAYAEGFDGGAPAAAPSKGIAVVACMDARLDLARMLGLEAGDANIIRNAGGIVSDDVIRSLMISQRMLGTREIMLIHHTGCGMHSVAAAALQDDVYRDTGLRPPFAMETFPDVEDDVRQSIARIKASPFIPHKDAVRGFVYEVDSGRLREVI